MDKFQAARERIKNKGIKEEQPPPQPRDTIYVPMPLHRSRGKLARELEREEESLNLLVEEFVSPQNLPKLFNSAFRAKEAEKLRKIKEAEKRPRNEAVMLAIRKRVSAYTKSDIDSKCEELHQALVNLGVWWKAKGKTLPEVSRPNVKQIRKCASYLKKLVEDPFFNPALLDEDFQKWPFWKLPVLLNSYADLLKGAAATARGVSRHDVYRYVWLLGVEQLFRRYTGKFDLKFTSRMLSELGFKLGLNENDDEPLRKAMNRAKQEVLRIVTAHYETIKKST